MAPSAEIAQFSTLPFELQHDIIWKYRRELLREDLLRQKECTGEYHQTLVKRLLNLCASEENPSECRRELHENFLKECTNIKWIDIEVKSFIRPSFPLPFYTDDTMDKFKNRIAENFELSKDEIRVFVNHSLETKYLPMVPYTYSWFEKYSKDRSVSVIVE